MSQQSDNLANGLSPLSANSNRALSPLADERQGMPPGGGFTYAPDTDSDTFDWQRPLSILRRRRRIIALTMGAVMSLAFIYILLSPKIYKATADLLINSEQKSSSGSDSLPALQDLLGATGTRSQDTEVEILRSAVVQQEATKLVPVSMRAKIRKNVVIDIQPKRSTDIISVNVQSRDPKLAIAYSNAICEAYRLQNQQNNTSQYRDTAQYVGGQLDVVRKKLNEKRDELRKFKEGSNIVDLPTESQARVSRLSELEANLQQVEADRLSNEAQLRDLQAQAGRLSPAEVAPSLIVVRPIVQQLRTQLTALENQRLGALQEFTKGSPEVKTLDEQIAALRQRLKTEASTEVGTYTRNINPVRQSILQSISQLQGAIWSTQARADALRQSIALARQTVRLLPEREYRLSQLQSDLAIYQQTFQSLSDKYQTLLISQETPVANARIITPAEEAQKVSPHVGSTLMMALMGGLILSLALALAIDTLDNKIYTEVDATQATGLPVLTHVPLLSGVNSESLLIHSAESSILLESFRMLRTQLSFISSYGNLKTLVLTSSQPNEGKSTVCANLAIALALNGKRVVLVDADLRRPTIHTIFKHENIKGFTNIVAGLCSIEEALLATEIDGLQILTSGPKPPNPPELLDSRASRNIIDQLKETHDYVIIDAPPALLMADAQIISTMSDGVILVVSCEEARRGAVERTYELMSQTGIKMIGMVLNKFTSEQSGYYGYYGYKYSGYDAYIGSKNDEGKALNPKDL